MTVGPTPQVRVDRDRLWVTLMELKEIGAYDDDATGLRGVRRLALTDAEARRDPNACGDGIDVLANAVLRLANEP